MTEWKRNAFRCKKCGMVVESKSVHDFQACKCGNSTDGGLEYIRRGGRIEDMEDLSEPKAYFGENKMENDMKALNDLVEEYANKETELMKVENELATRDEQFASFITTQKRLAEQKSVLTDMIKEFMTEHNMTEHETDVVVLKLAPSGKYRTENIEEVDDSVCDVKKVLSNKKVKAFLELNGKLPDGVESTGSVLRIRIKEESSHE